MHVFFDDLELEKDCPECQNIWWIAEKKILDNICEMCRGRGKIPSLNGEKFLDFINFWITRYKSKKEIEK